MLTPWLLLVVLISGANWAAFLLLRGRWGRIAVPLAAASLLGSIAGDAIAGRIGIDLLRLGTVHVVAACIGAQVAMLMVLLLGTLAPGVTE